MAEQLASVPEESATATGFTAPNPQPPRNTYRDRIRKVPVSGAPKKWTLVPLSQSGHKGSSYSSSGASNSCPSNNSDSSCRTVPVFAPLADNDELMRIARQMFSDGYTRHMVQAFDDTSSAPAFKYGGVPDHALENWFLELDVDWVLQIHDKHDLRRLLQDKPASTLQDLVERWIRALTVIVTSITELVLAFHGTPAAARFGKASITEMFVFVDTIIPLLKAEKLHVVLDMFICVSGASFMFTPAMISPEVQNMFSEIGSSLEKEGNKLSEAISSTMGEVRALMEDDESWEVEIKRGGCEVHTNTRFIIDCVVLMRKAQASTENSTGNHNTGNLRDLIDDTIDYLKGLLLTKSKLCSDPSHRYLFLLNNLYFLSQVSEPSLSLDIELCPGNIEIELTPECEKYMDMYLDVFW
ncbi:uncharacterized protein LOC119358338 [Triticum dicoccoides]|uniref:uncharacterized protein LOC119358338 n=1 Tax=Triticum dicoccoides TaxID=85692 RepID=UPI00188F477F|nr:uncharacterized protein LOC119358338 [Triticum dicoccoides]